MKSARRIQLLAAASGLLAAAAFALPSTTASAAPVASPDTAARVASHLGAASTAGSYYDAASHHTVVNVTTQAAADAVRAAGATPRMVEHSSAELAQAGKAVRTADLAGTAWSVDPRTDTLQVSADSRVTPAQVAQLKKSTAAYGDAVKVTRVAGTFGTRLSGGDPIYTTSWRCSVGFNVRSGSTYYFLTAGHCTEGYPDYYTSAGTYIGPTLGTSFPGNDYGIVRYDGAVSVSGTVGSQDITSAANAYVGEHVTRRGSTTGVHSGTVLALNATVNYGGGDVVYGLIETNVCAEPGDSGGSLYDGTKAIGLTSGGSGDCTSGGTTFFQPVTEALNAYGVSVF